MKLELLRPVGCCAILIVFSLSALAQQDAESQALLSLRMASVTAPSVTAAASSTVAASPSSPVTATPSSPVVAAPAGPVTAAPSSPVAAAPSSPVVAAPAGQQRTPAQVDNDRKLQAATFVAVADMARDFQTRYPGSSNLSEAKKIEAIALMRAVRGGAVENEAKAVRLAIDFRADSRNASADRFQVATLARELEIRKKNITSHAQLLDEYEKNANDLFGEFPDEPTVYEMYLGVARSADPVRARAMATKIQRMPAPASAKKEAQTILDRLDMPGKTLAFEFQDAVGKTHQLSEYKGKVVVFYVWATWTPATTDSDGKIKKLVPPSAVLVSVNVDTDVNAAQAAKSKSNVGGVEYYDSRGLQSPLPLQLNVAKVPSVHVVNAQGVFVGSGTIADLSALLKTAGL